MITNGIVTFIRETENSYEYHSYPAMWQGKGGFTAVNKQGEQSTAQAVIFVPDINADIAVGDFAVRGTYASDGSTLVNVALRVTGLTKHDYGSTDMQHIRAEVS